MQKTQKPSSPGIQRSLAYSILYVYYFSKFSHNCKIFFYVIYNVSVKIQVFFFKSKGENDHENENTHIFLVYKKILDLNNLGHFASVRLFHPVRLLVFRKYATLYGYSILYFYLILKSRTMCLKSVEVQKSTEVQISELE